MAPRNDNAARSRMLMKLKIDYGGGADPKINNIPPGGDDPLDDRRCQAWRTSPDIPADGHGTLREFLLPSSEHGTKGLPDA